MKYRNILLLPIVKNILEHIKKRGDEYVVTNKSGSKTLGHHDTKKDAQKQLAAIEIHKHEGVEMDEEEKIEEISTSGAAGAYLTPAAFRGNGEAAKQKQRRSATTSGYTMVNRPEEKGDDVSPQKDPHTPVSFGKKGD